jgi:hypothetical protein
MRFLGGMGAQVKQRLSPTLLARLTLHTTIGIRLSPSRFLVMKAMGEVGQMVTRGRRRFGVGGLSGVPDLTRSSLSPDTGLYPLLHRFLMTVMKGCQPESARLGRAGRR